MDDKRVLIKKCIEEAEISPDLKARELEIVNDMSLSIPEIEMALAEMITEEFNAKMEEVGLDTDADEEERHDLEQFETEASSAMADLEKDMSLLDENLKAIKETAEEIQKTSLQAGLVAS